MFLLLMKAVVGSVAFLSAPVRDRVREPTATHWRGLAGSAFSLPLARSLGLALEPACFLLFSD
jgi:hypothetical protein